MKSTFALVALGLSLAAITTAAERREFKPTEAQLKASYTRGDSTRTRWTAAVRGLRFDSHWVQGGKAIWFQTDDPTVFPYQFVDSTTGKQRPLFDIAVLTAALAAQTKQAVDPTRLSASISQLKTDETGLIVSFNWQNRGWKFDSTPSTLTEIKPIPVPARPPREPWIQDTFPPEQNHLVSPDKKHTAWIQANAVILADANGKQQTLAIGTDAEYDYRLEWTPDSSRLILITCIKGDRKLVYLIESSPANGGPAVMKQRMYDRPGDKIDRFNLFVINPNDTSVKTVQAPANEYDGPPNLRWLKDGHSFTYGQMDRGYSRWRLFKVDAITGEASTVLDDHPKTFVDSTSQYIHYLADDSMVWRSEQDGWGHLYYVRADGTIQRLTQGQWVVRSVVQVDEKNRRVVFGASGVHPGEDPYFVHFYSVSLDGGPITELTPEPGQHEAHLSPNGEVLLDEYSTVSSTPSRKLRNVPDGKLIADLGKVSDVQLKAAGWKPPQVFVAKGRDGQTDIWGVVYRPTNFDPRLSYPVVEDIYAGPQDSFVPKSFRPFFRNQSLAELGLIVVQIDGMGTRNRGKAFHDVAYKNIKDAGFPDRIAWMKALAQAEPSADISRVGVFGTSAGGQNSTGALLFHPEFYKVAVSSCGCHDNRLDKIWWNEQWMGYPIGPEYSASSNIDNAAKLQGHLLLFVGELDTNVPPESTYRLCDALVKAKKDFDFFVLPGSDHTDGGPFGERKRRDFLVRHLLHVEPPAWNADHE